MSLASTLSMPASHTHSPRPRQAKMSPDRATGPLDGENCPPEENHCPQLKKRYLGTVLVYKENKKETLRKITSSDLG